MTDDGNRLNPGLKESFWIAVVIGILAFALDWSGFEKWQPDLFFPKPLGQVWWHLPIIISTVFLAIQYAKLLDWAKAHPIYPAPRKGREGFGHAIRWIALLSLLVLLLAVIVWQMLWLLGS